MTAPGNWTFFNVRPKTPLLEIRRGAVRAFFSERRGVRNTIEVRSWGCLSSDPSRITLYAFLVILPKNRELFSFERTLGMNGEHGLVTTEFTGCQVGDQVDRP